MAPQPGRPLSLEAVINQPWSQLLLLAHSCPHLAGPAWVRLLRYTGSARCRPSTWLALRL
jgi:hypothetical protein